MDNDRQSALWYERKRTLFGLPLSFTKYYFLDEKLIVKSGFLRLREEEIRFYRILDVSLTQTLGQRIFGLGTIHLCSADKSMPELDIMNIKKPKKAKDLLSDLVEKARDDKRISAHEFIGSGLDNGTDNLH